MFFRPVVAEKPGMLIAPKLGQVILANLLIVVLAVLGFWSVNSMQQHESERSQIFAEESDASAMVYAQRESFNVLIAIEQWNAGKLTGRDVQIARALLGQRLTVETASGVYTSDLAHVEYRDALDDIDYWLLLINDVGSLQKRAFYSDMSDSLDNFARQTRQLDKTFQQVSRDTTTAALAERAQSDLVQTLLLGFAMILGAILSAWVAMDILRGYRRISKQIAEERAELDTAIEQLDLMHRLEAKAARWAKEVVDGEPSDKILKNLASDLSTLGNGLVVDFDLRPEAELAVSVCTIPQGGINRDELTILLRRAEEIVTSLRTRDAAVEELEFQRKHDALTGIPNREMFLESVQAKLNTRIKGKVLAVAIFDIDRFGDVNAALGYSVGDKVLVEAADTLSRITRGRENIARLSADEFAIVGEYDDHAEVDRRVNEIVNSLTFQVDADEVESAVTASVGYMVCDGHMTEASELISCASTAIYVAKSETERRGCVEFDLDKHSHLMTTWHEELAVRIALRSGEFKLYYQPLVDCATRRPVGAEALIRWDRPGTGIVNPNDFLPIVQRAGIAVEMGWFVIEEAFQFWNRNVSEATRSDPERIPYISINLDAEQLEMPSLAPFIINSAKRNQVPLKSVVLEVTEHSLASSDLARDQLIELRNAGARIALDDFGTGYSSLGQAHNLPLDILKIDRSFLPEGDQGPEGWDLVSDIKRIADTLNLAVVAEGVETPSMADKLCDLGIDYGQGYLFSRPIPEADFTDWWDEAIEEFETSHR